MPKYLLKVTYASDGIKGLIKDGGTNRRATAEKVTQSLGGSLEAFYFAFGETDAFLIVDVPDNVSMAAIAMTVSGSGAVTLKTTPLLSPEEVDEAVKKTPSYSPPGT